MKALFVPLSITVMIISLLFASCNANKSAQASSSTNTKTTNTKTKKQSTAVSPKKEEIVTTKTEALEVPPIDIKNNFSSRFPTAEKPTWNKQSTPTGATTTKTRYNVVFVEDGKKNWIAYSDNGEVIEERQEILIDQLPQNIYNAIRINYPTYKVVSATTYKSTKKEGSYAVTLKPLSKFDTKEIEVILTEDASLVE